MDFNTFKEKYEKVPVVEYANNRKVKLPLVTIKVVTYNHENYIQECLESLVNQKTDFDFEVLIAEDESSDTTRQICINFAEKYPNRIRLLLNSRENNIPIKGKPSGTFNSVYANFSARGKYLTTIEGDDYWLDMQSLQKRVDFLENNSEFVACFHNTKVVNQQSLDEHLVFKLNEDKTIKFDDLLKVWIPTVSFLYRHKLINLFDEDMKNIVCGDLILRGKLAEFGAAKYLHNIQPAVYRVHKGGVFSSQSLDVRNKLAIEGLQYLLNYYKIKNTNFEIKKSVSYLYLSYFVAHLKRDKKVVFNYVKLSFKYGNEVNYSFLQIIKDYFFSKF
tara:strand:+ start:6111 stop:7106 length:996 start_codon:yes stop_codon:yes gene_type:complete